VTFHHQRVRASAASQSVAKGIFSELPLKLDPNVSARHDRQTRAIVPGPAHTIIAHRVPDAQRGHGGQATAKQLHGLIETPPGAVKRIVENNRDRKGVFPSSNHLSLNAPPVAGPVLGRGKPAADEVLADPHPPTRTLSSRRMEALTRIAQDRCRSRP